jgi:hypothetical protein
MFPFASESVWQIALTDDRERGTLATRTRQTFPRQRKTNDKESGGKMIEKVAQRSGEIFDSGMY